jgi:leucyl aminopeptidase
MSLPPCFATPDAAGAAIPLLAIDRAGLPGLLEKGSPQLRRWVQAQGFTAEPGSILLVPDADGAPASALIGISDPADPLALAPAPLCLPPGDYRLNGGGLPIDVGNALLGWGLGAYQFQRYRKPPRSAARLVLHDNASQQSEAFALLKASTLVRDLINTPTEEMGPDEMEAVARRIAHAYDAGCHVIRGDELLAQGFPAIHAVGRASHRAPRLIELNWGDPSHPRVAIVGKAVCFDTGGLSIKAGEGMRNMKKDMGGAAHALGLAQLVMARKLKVRLQLLLPTVENAIGPDSYRPGDVINTRAGLTVEIDNTDAEGRVVLCDALAYAAESQPLLMLDFATLTGAARIALGPELPALYCNDEALASEYLAASARTRDPLWRMPLWQPYMSYLSSNIADMTNSGGSRMAGSITAALYLQRFVPESIPWAHSDVYSWNDSARAGRPAGGEAQGLRAAFDLLKARYGS